MSFYKPCIYSELPRSEEQLSLPIIKLASALFAGTTGLSGPQIFEFFSRYSEAIGKMRYGEGVPSRWMMFENFLESLPITVQRQALLELCDDYPMRTKPPIPEVGRLRRMLASGSVADSPAKRPETQAMSYDVFICHASEDKVFTDLLAAELRSAGIRVWYDQFILSWGDDLRATIDEGLVQSKFGIVVFSPAFLKKKKWTEHELSGLFAKEKAGIKIILPIWHNITESDIIEYGPSFAARLAKNTAEDSVEDIVASLLRKLGHN